MNFNAIIDAANAANGTGAAQSNAASTQMLGQSDFLKLLTTQLTMQDPTDPVDNKEMIAQMAQFSSLAGLSQINDTLKLILTKLDDIATAQSSQGGTTTPTDNSAASTAPAATA